MVSQAAGERNFHVFYLIFAGLSASEKSQYSLESPDTYEYINTNSEAIRQIGSLKGQFDELREGLNIIGFSPEEIDTLVGCN